GYDNSVANSIESFQLHFTYNAFTIHTALSLHTPENSEDACTSAGTSFRSTSTNPFRLKNRRAVSVKRYMWVILFSFARLMSSSVIRDPNMRPRRASFTASDRSRA